MARLPGFVGPAYTSQSKVAACDQLYNWYVEKIESGTGSVDFALYPAPGFASYCSLGTAPFRGAFSLNGTAYAVNASTLSRPTSTGTTGVAFGLSNPDNSPVSMAGNGDAGHQVMIASGSTLYCFDTTSSTLTTITGVSGAFMAFLDGYFIALDPNRSEIHISDLEDGTSWDPLDVAQRSDSADKWVSMLLVHKELWLFGTQSGSVYYNSGDAGFPFVPNPSVQLSHGCAAPRSPCVLEGDPIWLADDHTVRMAQGYKPMRVSTHAVEYAIAQYASVSDAHGDVYQEQGHTFYILSFPSANATWVYDATMGMWSQRGAWNGVSFDVLPVWGHINVNGTWLAGDRTASGTSVLYRQSADLATDVSGAGMERMRRAPHLVQELKRVVYDEFQLRLETGLGLVTGQGSDPQVMLRWSNDGAQTWSNVYSMPAGAIGEFSTRVVWTKLGMARDRVFEISVSDPIPWRILDALIEVRGGIS
jgi:hypothetical protein